VLGLAAAGKYFDYYKKSKLSLIYIFYRYFRTQAAMQKHANEKHNDVTAREKAQCIFCGAAYLGKQAFNRHVRRKHKREAHFCTWHNCGGHYRTDGELQAHVKEAHDDATFENKIVACSICGLRFSNLRYLQNHNGQCCVCKS
jgi:hypothetical protein